MRHHSSSGKEPERLQKAASGDSRSPVEPDQDAGEQTLFFFKAAPEQEKTGTWTKSGLKWDPLTAIKKED